MTASYLPSLVYETLEVGEARDGTHSMAHHRLSTWSFLYHDVDSLSQIKNYAESRDNQ
jgi:hypothetical protein